MARILVILFLILPPFIIQSATEISLSSGWNLITVPLNSPRILIDDYLQSNLSSGEVLKIWNYDGGWKSYSTGASNTLTAFEQNRGYWFLMNTDGGTLNYSSNAAIQGLEIAENGWALASFNQGRDLDSTADVFLEENIKSTHTLSNIAKVWGYSGVWKSFVPSSGSGDLTTMAAGSAFWFLLQNLNSETLELSPKGAVGSELIIGGATSLMPPNANQIGGSISRVAPSRFSTMSAFSSTVSSNAVCDPSNEGTVIGYAKAFSLSGKALNDPSSSPIICNISEGQALPVTYEIRFNSEEQAYLLTNPTDAQNIVISVELNSGQEVKSVLPDQLSDRLEGKSEGSVDATVNESSSLSVALLALEVANKLGVPADQLKLGEQNAGLGDLNSSIAEITQKDELDVKGFSQLAQAAATAANSPFKALADKIKEINDPSSLANSNRSASKSDEIANLLSGSSSDSDDSDFAQSLQKAKQLASAGSKLLAGKKKALKKGVVTESAQSSNQSSDTADSSSTLDALANDLFLNPDVDESFIDVVDVVSDSLALTEATSGNQGLEQVTKDRFTQLIGSVSENLSSIRTGARDKALSTISEAVAFPQELVKDFASNPEAARGLAGILGKATAALQKSQEQDAASTQSADRVLDSIDDTVSALSGSRDLLDTLVKNAPDTDTVSEILSSAVESSADNTGAADLIFEKISQLKSEVESGGELQVDFTSIMKKSVGRAKDVKNIAKALARNADNASDAMAIIGEAAGALTPNEMQQVLADDKLKNDFKLDERIFADAGRPQKIEYSGNTAIVKLDGRASFDPVDPTGLNLTYQWYESQGNNDSSAVKIEGATSALSTITVTGLDGGNDTRHYQLIVSTTDGSGRESSDMCVVQLRSKQPPVIVLAKYYQGKEGQTLVVDASESFNPKTGSDEGLTYQWSFDNDGSLSLSAENTAKLLFNASRAGLYEGQLRLCESSDSSNCSSASIRIAIKGVRPPIADAGFDLTLTQPKLIEKFDVDGGIRLRNFSFSAESGGTSGLTYLWEPRSYFSNTQGSDSTSRNPLFTVTDAGEYAITLTVTEGSGSSAKSAQDKISIIILAGKPPIAFAGQNRVIKLAEGDNIIQLDGSRSFSYYTTTPNFAWSGPVAFDGDIDDQANVSFTLNSDDFTQRQLLRFSLRVSDAFSSSEDEIYIAVLPPSRPPLVFLDVLPRKPIYEPSDRILLDTSFSFSDTNSNLQYVWKNINGLQVLNQNGSVDTSSDLTDSRLIVKIPDAEEITQYTEFVVKLTVTDTGNAKSTVEKVVFRVAPPILPPVAKINPTTLLVQDHNDENERQIVKVDGLGSYSRGGGALSYQWSFDQTLLELNSGSSLDSEVIELRAVSEVDDNKTVLQLTVTDIINKLSTTASIPVLVKKAKQPTRPVELQAFFRRSISETTFEENPRLDTVSGLSVFSSDTQTESILVLARAFDPNFEENPATHNLSTALYSFDKSSGSRGSQITTVGLDIIGNSSFETSAKFAVFFDKKPSAGAYVLDVMSSEQTDSSTAYDQSVSLNFEIESDVLEPIVADLKIIAVESISQGYEMLSTASYSNSFVDDRIRVILKGSFSGRADSHSVAYRFSSSSDNSDIGRLFITNLGAGRAEVLIPVPLALTTFDLSLVVKDMVRPQSSSQATTATLQIQKVLNLPPVANAGEYPEFVLQQDQQNILVKLDGRKSFSPVGNPLNYRWSYLGNGSVFSSGTTSNAIVAEANLGEGEHLFELRVTDARTGLSDTQFVALLVERKIANTIDYVVEGEFFVPSAVKENSNVALKVKLNVIRVNSDSDPVDFSKLHLSVRINDSLVTNQLINTNEFFSSQSFSYGTTHKIEIYAFYDSNGDTLDNDFDSAKPFVRSRIVDVIKNIKPITSELHLRDSPNSSSIINVYDGRFYSKLLETVLTIKNPNVKDSWSNVSSWTDNISYQILDANTLLPKSFTVSNQTTLVYNISQTRISETSSIQHSFKLSLPLGDLVLNADIQSVADSGEIAVGQAKHRLWVRQVPHLKRNTAFRHGLDLTWQPVFASNRYQVLLKKSGQSVTDLLIETTTTKLRLENLISVPHQISVIDTQTVPYWTANLDRSYEDDLSVNVPLNFSPTATVDSAITTVNTSILLNVLANDNDADGDRLYITDITNVSGGTTQLSEDIQAINVTPALNTTSPITFVYSISDQYGGIDSAKVIVFIKSESSKISPSGTMWQDPLFGIKYQKVDYGEFSMGSPLDETDRNSNEIFHEQIIGKQFYLGKYEVTQAQWEDVMRSGQAHTYNSPQLNVGSSSQHPIYNISWHEITKIDGFLDRLNLAMGCDIISLPQNHLRYSPSNVPAGCFRLPTEAEWEYAARAGTQSRFSYGDDPDYNLLSQFGWYNNVDTNSTNQVGTKLPNQWGLHDMHGNVWEWVYDGFSINTPESKLNFFNEPDQFLSTIKGGAWDSNVAELRSASRRAVNHDQFEQNLGFRVLLVTDISKNIEPIANDDRASVAEDKSVIIDVLANDIDLDGGALQILDILNVSDGSATLTTNSTSILYLPDSNFWGHVTVDYSVSDDRGGTDSAQLNIEVHEVNDRPVAMADTAIVTEDGTIILELIENDVDIDQDRLTISAINAVMGGSVKLLNDSTSVKIKPYPDSNSDITFNYEISDDRGKYDTTSVVVKVLPVNDSPFTIGDSVVLMQGSSIILDTLANDLDIDDDQLRIISIDLDSHNLVSITSDSQFLLVNAHEQFFGNTLIDYTVSDGKGGNVKASLDVTIRKPNNSPVAVNDSAIINLNQSVLMNVLSNDYDPDGDEITIHSIENVIGGSVSINEEATAVFIVPETDSNETISFEYVIQDTFERRSKALALISVNSPPKALDDIAFRELDHRIWVNVLKNDFDPENEALQISNVTAISGGTASLNYNNTALTVRSTTGSTVPIVVNYTVVDQHNASSSATLTVYVITKPTNEIFASQDDFVQLVVSGDPLKVKGHDDYAYMKPNTQLILDVWSNDKVFNSWKCTEPYPYRSIQSIQNVSGASVEISTDSKSIIIHHDIDTSNDIITLNYNPSYCGVTATAQVGFSYDSSSDDSSSDDSSSGLPRVTVEVNEYGNPPQANADFIDTFVNQPLSINLLDNDFDTENDPFYISQISNISGAQIILNTDNATVDIIPDLDSITPVLFTYEISDAGARKSTASVRVGIIESIPMIRISSGSFIRGSKLTETDRDVDEGPTHQVAISSDFYLGKYEVTQQQWEALMGKSSIWSADMGMSATHPAYGIPWIRITQVDGFLDRLNRVVGCDLTEMPDDNNRYHPQNVKKGCFRLPTEAEWEYAARAGSMDKFSHGNDYAQLGNYAWYKDNSDLKKHPIGQKLPNSWGLYDIYGNLDEWVFDVYGAYIEENQRDPTGPRSTYGLRIARGGSMNAEAPYVRSSFRVRDNISSEIGQRGFRLLRVIESPVHGNNNQNDALSAPDQVWLRTGDGYITLHWSPVESASSYCAQIQTNNSVNISNVSSFCVAAPITHQTFTDLKDDQQYYFAVKALATTTQSTYSATITTIYKKPPYLVEPPVTLSAVPLANGMVDINWSNVAEAQSYTVWSGLSNVDLSVSQSHILSTNYLLEPGRSDQLFIAISATSGDNSNNQNYLLSPIITAKPIKPSTPSITDIEIVSNGLKVLWSPTYGAVDYTLFGGLVDQPYLEIDSINTDKTSAVANTIYQTKTYFELVANNYAGHSDYSSVKWAIPLTGFETQVPSAPTDIRAVANDDMSISINGLHSYPVNNYMLYWDDQPQFLGESNFKNIAIDGDTIFNSKDHLKTRWHASIFESLTSTTIFIGVKASNRFGESSMSELTSVNIDKAPTVTDLQAIGMTRFLTADVKLTWTNLAGVIDYRIYYSKSNPVTLNDQFELAQTPYTFTENGYEYFAIRAANRVGYGDLSASVSITAPSSWKQPDYNLDLLLVNAGTFMMGSDTDEVGRWESEGPQKKVTIEHNFYLGKYEITQKQWEMVMGENHWPLNEPSLEFGKSSSHPAYFISWDDITGVGGFLDTLNNSIGCNTDSWPNDNSRYHPSNVPANCYRLPTEAEWEYAVRAGTSTRFSYGDDNQYTQLDDYAWYANNSYNLGPAAADYGAQPVGKKRPNLIGFHDMHGNVWEFTYDWNKNYLNSPSINPAGPATGTHKLIRGGSWYDSPENLRSARRRILTPSTRDSNVGFRVLLVQE